MRRQRVRMRILESQAEHEDRYSGLVVVMSLAGNAASLQICRQDEK